VVCCGSGAGADCTCNVFAVVSSAIPVTMPVSPLGVRC
jgi:hypothetical protein